MNERLILPIIVLVSVPLLGFCATVKREGGPNTSTAQTKQTEVKQNVSIEELKRRYASAKTEYERRDVCLQAIDQNSIYRDGPVSTVDEIFGTHFASDLPKPGKSNYGSVQFVPFVPSPDDSVAAGHVGWRLVIEYSSSGKILNYYLTNLHK